MDSAKIKRKKRIVRYTKTENTVNNNRLVQKKQLFSPKKERYTRYTKIKNTVDNNRLIQKKQLSSLRKKTGWVFVALFTVLLFIFTDMISYDILFLSFFISMFWFDLDSRISIGGALLFLILIMIILLFGQIFAFSKSESLAELFAIWVYYFLAIGVIKQIFEFMRNKKHAN